MEYYYIMNSVFDPQKTNQASAASLCEGTGGILAEF